MRRFQNFPYAISVFIVWQITKCYIVKKSNFSDHWVGPRKDDANHESRQPASLAVGSQNFTIFPKFSAAGKIFQGAPVSPVWDIAAPLRPILFVLSHKKILREGLDSRKILAIRARTRLSISWIVGLGANSGKNILDEQIVLCRFVSKIWHKKIPPKLEERLGRPYL